MVSAAFVHSGGALLSVVFVFCFNYLEEREGEVEELEELEEISRWGDEGRQPQQLPRRRQPAAVSTSEDHHYYHWTS